MAAMTGSAGWRPQGRGNDASTLVASASLSVTRPHRSPRCRRRRRIGSYDLCPVRSSPILPDKIGRPTATTWGTRPASSPTAGAARASPFPLPQQVPKLIDGSNQGSSQPLIWQINTTTKCSILTTFSFILLLGEEFVV